MTIGVGTHHKGLTLRSLRKGSAISVSLLNNIALVVLTLPSDTKPFEPILKYSRSLSSCKNLKYWHFKQAGAEPRYKRFSFGQLIHFHVFIFTCSITNLMFFFFIVVKPSMERSCTKSVAHATDVVAPRKARGLLPSPPIGFSSCRIHSLIYWIMSF